MKNIILKICTICFLTLSFMSCVFAKNADIAYKNIKNNSKIYFCENDYSWALTAKCNNYKIFIKKASDTSETSSEFYTNDGELAFQTGTQYEFIHNGKLIGYSNDDLKFYQYNINSDGNIQKDELSLEEVQSLFENTEVIALSEFSNSTNSLKIKKERGSLKILLLNDTNKTFSDYSFTSSNAKFKKYTLTGFIDVLKPGMIQFSAFGDNTKNSPWYVLLIR